MYSYRLIFIFILFLISCKDSSVNHTINIDSSSESLKIEYAKGFEIKCYKDYTILKILKPWPESKKKFTYLLYKKDKTSKIPKDLYDAELEVPLQNIVVTSTTHIPSLESLKVLHKLLGFPNTDYLSSDAAISLVEANKIRDIGSNESLNTELLLDLNPQAVVSFAVKGQNNSLSSLHNAGIPVLYNADWVEQHPLGRAEWIKFFGVLFDKNKESKEIFDSIAYEYNKVKSLAKNSIHKPSVLSGALWKDTWYLPAGKSWQAQILKDANADYLFEESKGSGSISLPLESVLMKAKDAEYWVAPAQHTSYQQMLFQYRHYGNFKAFQEKKIFTYALTTGKNGGIQYYEMAPNRPDWVLKDMIKILHPEVLPTYSLHFFKPLKP